MYKSFLWLDCAIISWNLMIVGYVRKKRLVDARILFDRMLTRDVVSWNTMVSVMPRVGKCWKRDNIWNLLTMLFNLTKLMLGDFSIEC